MAAMAGSKKHRRGGGGPPPAPTPEAIGAELESLVAQIRAQADPAGGPVWGVVHRALIKSPIDKAEAAAVIARRDVAALEAIAARLQGRVPEVTGEPAAVEPDPVDAVDPETMKKAMRAFRKRLRLTRLDEESRLGVGPMTGGKHSQVSAIIPPNDFPRPVWDALVRAGRLHDRKQGFYELVEE